MENALISLKNAAWKTQKSRFIAAERCRKKHNALVFSISFLSIAQVFIAILEGCKFSIPILHIDSTNSNYITLLMAIMVLVIANQDSLSKLLANADNYHRCANQILYLSKKLEGIPSEMTSEGIKAVEQISKEYSSILERFDLNHLPNDYSMVMAKHPKYFTLSCIERLCIYITHISDIYTLPLIYCSAPFLILFISKHT
ncbi:SLATT domain-containing protein [Desulfovibrio sp.]|uniref:SLATT domain-containing protein n=1 Tax=Desulfovibrio sp. TaxID=885 RepID=UPI0035B10798